MEDHETEVKKAADKLKEIHGEVKYDNRQLLWHVKAWRARVRNYTEIVED